MAKYRVFACEILFRELCYEAAQSRHVIDLSFNHFGLHHVGCEKMAAELQSLVDSVEEMKYDAILFGYGLCNNGIAGLKSRAAPLVIPKAHDCITLLLGSKEKYKMEFDREPGTYYHSSGWLEHHNLEEEESVYNKLGLNMSYNEMIRQYGEENARYLRESLEHLGSFKETYTRLVYIDTGLGPKEDLIEKSRLEAKKNGWRFDVLQGDRSLIRKMLNGNWDESEFLILPPGQTIKPTYDSAIIKAEV